MATTDKPSISPSELIKQGFIKTISIHEFQPDQRLVEAALNATVPTQQQGGVCDSAMPTRASQFGFNRRPVPAGFTS